MVFGLVESPRLSLGEPRILGPQHTAGILWFGLLFFFGLPQFHFSAQLPFKGEARRLIQCPFLQTCPAIHEGIMGRLHVGPLLFVNATCQQTGLLKAAQNLLHPFGFWSGILQLRAQNPASRHVSALRHHSQENPLHTALHLSSILLQLLINLFGP